ncbi:MAG: type III pantothenate kinase [Phycisphaerae bacterium]|nr:type III pantothenate kinase [Phycisphaerae bacterium]
MDMIAVDVGNGTVSIGVFTNDKLQKSEHISVDQAAKKLPNILVAFREMCGVQAHGASTVPVVACSVNPDHLAIVQEAVRVKLNQRALVIGQDFPLEMKVALDALQNSGSDRLVTAYGAYEVIGSALVVADFGTATTIDCVNEHGIFLGGVIMPGLSLAAKSLYEHTAALPLVTPATPVGNCGISTETAINNGIMFQALGALQDVVERYANEIGQWPQVVATGGHSKLIAAHCEFIDSLVPDLCLDGLYLAYGRYLEITPPEL